MFGWRRFILRLFGARVGKGVRVYPGVKIWAPWNLVLDSNCGVADGVTLYSQALIHIGHRSVLSQGVHVCTGTHDYGRNDFPLVAKAIDIGSDVWIAADAFLHPGVSIGTGSVVGARSVVVKDVQPWMVCAGHPCVALKPRTINL